MGIRSRLKKLANRFSGEHSDAAPEAEPIPYARDGSGSDDAPVLKARLNRPRDQGSDKESSDES
jgi:hypothetical protein